VAAGANLRAMSVRIQELPKRSLIDIAKQAKAIAAQVGVNAGSPLKGNKKRGMKLRAVDDLRMTGTGATLRIQGVNPAGWVWVNTGTRPHTIRRRKRGKRSRMTVPHPGTSGRGAWRQVDARVRTQVIPAVIREHVAWVMRG